MFTWAGQLFSEGRDVDLRTDNYSERAEMLTCSQAIFLRGNDIDLQSDTCPQLAKMLSYQSPLL